jgi:hypothetical protein
MPVTAEADTLAFCFLSQTSNPQVVSKMCGIYCSRKDHKLNVVKETIVFTVRIEWKASGTCGDKFSDI